MSGFLLIRPSKLKNASERRSRGFSRTRAVRQSRPAPNRRCRYLFVGRTRAKQDSVAEGTGSCVTETCTGMRSRSSSAGAGDHHHWSRKPRIPLVVGRVAPSHRTPHESPTSAITSRPPTAEPLRARAFRAGRGGGGSTAAAVLAGPRRLASARSTAGRPRRPIPPGAGTIPPSCYVARRVWGRREDDAEGDVAHVTAGILQSRQRR